MTEVALALGLGASWGDDDRIVFSGGAGLLEVSASGGTTTSLTILDQAEGELSHRLPQVLPGGEAVLFTIAKNRFPRWDETQIAVYSRRTGQRKVLVNGARTPLFSVGAYLDICAKAFPAAPSIRTSSSLSTLAFGRRDAGGVLKRAGGPGGVVAISTRNLPTCGRVAHGSRRLIVRVYRPGRSETLRFRRVRSAPRSPDAKDALSTSTRAQVWLYALNAILQQLSALGESGADLDPEANAHLPAGISVPTDTR